MDKSIFTEKVLEAESTLYHVAKSILVQDADCEDAVQGAILKAYEKVNTLKDQKYFRTWLVRILINECYRLKRKKKAVVSYDEYFEFAAAEENENYSELYIAISKLPVKIRTTIVLYYIEEYSVDEIKHILRIPSGTVKSRLAKGRKILKLELEQMEVAYA